MAEDGRAASGSEVSGPIRQVILISAGASHSVALLSGNIVCSWGRGEDGQLGHGDAEDRPTPTQLSTLDGLDIISITCGADHTTAYSESRMEVYSWGWGDFGRLGHGNSSDLFTPQPIKALHSLKIRQIACGDSHCLAVTMDGEVQSWGRNQNGQLGLGTTEDSLVPQKIQAFQGVSIKMVAAGAEHTAAVTEDGELYGWGWGRYGNLGLGDRNDRLVPEKVSLVKGDKMIMVACGWRHTISVSSSGGLYTYGWSKYGQLGHGDFEDHLTPHKVEALQDSYISLVILSPFIACFLWVHITVCLTGHINSWPLINTIFMRLYRWLETHYGKLTSDGNLYGWGWNKVTIFNFLIMILQVRFISYFERQALHLQMHFSKLTLSSYLNWMEPNNAVIVFTCRALLVQGQTVSVGGNGNDASVPESDVKRIRI
ncbi:ultraviolet-B receptor UVR8 [Populus alba]|uniref:ultraviolet-B receptor UVR8 n=1 Tax=Populus alba TaxID=43335 RepID=UPI003CC73BFD